jgi:hypothetical protein
MIIKQPARDEDEEDSEEEETQTASSVGGVKNSLLLTRSVVPIQGKEGGCLKAGD